MYTYIYSHRMSGCVCVHVCVFVRACVCCVYDMRGYIYTYTYVNMFYTCVLYMYIYICIFIELGMCVFDRYIYRYVYHVLYVCIVCIYIVLCVRVCVCAHGCVCSVCLPLPRIYTYMHMCITHLYASVNVVRARPYARFV